MKNVTQGAKKIRPTLTVCVDNQGNQFIDISAVADKYGFVLYDKNFRHTAPRIGHTSTPAKNDNTTRLWDGSLVDLSLKMGFDGIVNETLKRNGIKTTASEIAFKLMQGQGTIYPNSLGEYLDDVTNFTHDELPALISALLRNDGNKVKRFEVDYESPNVLSEVILRCLSERKSGVFSADEIAVFSGGLALLSYHGDGNNSTLTADSAASTGANVFHAIVAGLISLSGPLHGGASPDAAKMYKPLLGRSDISIARVFEENEGKFPGINHGYLSGNDPRGGAYCSLIRSIRPDIVEELEKIMKQVESSLNFKRAQDGKDAIEVFPNVDFYSWALWDLLNIPVEKALTMFQISRGLNGLLNQVYIANVCGLLRPAEVFLLENKKS